MAKARETVLELDLKALAHNYHYLRAKLQPETKFLSVVKAFAYGSDTQVIAKKLEELGTDYFAVAYTNEGVALRDAGITKPILVLHPQEVSFDSIIERCLEPSIYSKNILNEFLKTAKKHRQNNYPVHLKFNTGLNRLGFRKEDVAHIAAILHANNEIKAISVFSHLAASEDHSEKEFTQDQISLFHTIAEQLDILLQYRPFRHVLNTSGILNYSDAQYDMVRSGIALYGYGNEAKIDRELKPVARLKTIISQIHQLKPNESVGYNRSFAASGPKVTATLPLGHADGIGRHYGNGKTFVSVHGKKAPIIGNVCMDMIMIDITDIECNEGDEVIIFGSELSAQEFAETANTISYELLTGISQRVKRHIIS
ncbi:alanine racemase [Maribacter antarcticus]|uniref:alanine racemase n=1 Tax=Maribacter antarcticus TaxID=505250 RepID=UPI00047E4C70|nr:alanine racemase [Maribacter antarcticus]